MKLSTITDLELIEWLDNLIKAVTPDPAAYGLTPAQVTELTTIYNNLKSAVANRRAADEAARVAVAAQRDARTAADPLVTFVIAALKKNPALTDAERAAAGIEPNKPPTRTPPTMPTELTAEGFSAGYNHLKWNRSGNKPGTIYIIESRTGDAVDFVYLASTTETSYDHHATPGVQCAYRVKAQRAGEESLYSNPAVVYMK